MKVLVLSPDFPPGRGGIQLLAGRLVAELDGDDLTVLRLGRQRVLARRGGLKIRSLPLGSRVDQRLRVAFYNIWAVLLGLLSRPEAIVVTHIVAAPAARAIASFCRVPSVLVLHGQEIPHRRRLAAWAVSSSRRTIAVSEHTRRLAVDAGAPVEPIVIAHPGVDTPPEVKPPEDRAPCSIVTVARLVDSYKGHDVMLDAVEELAQTHPQTRWRVVGDGPRADDLRAEIERRSLGGIVEMLGSVSDEDRDRELDNATVFAMPSRVPKGGGGEGFGIVYLEAAARGLPVVAGAEGGAADAVADGRSGLLVDPRDPGAVADALRSVFDDDELRARLSAGALDWASTHTWAVFAATVRSTFDEVQPRVMAVSHTSAWGGAERSLVDQLAADRRRGARVLLAAPPGPLLDRAWDAGIEVREVKSFEASFSASPSELPGQMLRLATCGRELARLARDEQITVLHANSVRAALVCAVARAFGAPPAIAHVRDYLPDSSAGRVVRNVVTRSSAAVVANSFSTASNFAPRTGSAPNVVYNPISLGVDGVQPPGLPGDRRVVAQVGQIARWKGQHVAIESFAAIARKHDDVLLAIAGSAKFHGDGSGVNAAYRNELAELADRLGVGERVVFLGELAEVGTLLERADVLVMPSEREPFGRAAAEAMAAGVAVVATTNGGPAEFIEHGRSGMLADPTDIGAWSESLDLLLSDDELRTRIGRAASEVVRRRFAADSDEVSMLRLYREHQRTATR